MKIISCNIQIEEINIAENSLKQILNVNENDLDLDQFSKNFIQEKNKRNHLQQDYQIEKLIDDLDNLKALQGKGSRMQKENLIKEIFEKADSEIEIKYLIRLFQKNLRIGCNNKTIIKALKKLNEQNNISELIQDFEKKVFGFYTGLNKKVEVGLPIPVMLAKPITDYDQINDFFNKYEEKLISVELKYDGERTQVHYNKKNNILQLFSRNLELQNDKYQSLINDLHEYFNKNDKISSCILDGEIISLSENNEIQSFQQMQNKNIQQNFKVVLFDILYFNEQILLDQHLPHRQNIIEQNFEKKNPFLHVDKLIIDISKDLTSTIEKVNTIIQQGHEGAILKSLDKKKTYYDTQGSRLQWAKLKKNVTNNGIADTLDLVPIAVYWGKGKRQGKFGAYLMASFDSEKQQYVAMCKIGTGFTDEFMDSQTSFYQNNLTKAKPKEFLVSKTFKPDFWIAQPNSVWEIESDQFTLSPIYTIGKTEQQQEGLSLRFPRFKRLRDDKDIENSTKVQQIIEMFNLQIKK